MPPELKFKKLNAKNLCCPAIVLCLLAVGCGPKSRPSKVGITGATSQTAEARPAMEEQWGALRWVPVDAELVVVATSFNELLRFTEQAVLPIVSGIEGVTSSQLPSTQAVALPGPIWSPATWSGIGVDTESSVAAFGTWPRVTLVVPLSDAGRFRASQAEMVASLGARSIQVGGSQVHQAVQGDYTWSWLTLDQVLLVRVQLGAAGDLSDWLRSIESAAETRSYSSTDTARDALARALAVNTAPSLWGSINAQQILYKWAGGAEYVACARLLSHLEQLNFSALLGPESTTAVLELSLDATSADTMVSLLGPAASSGALAWRRDAGLYASLAVDPQSSASALRAADCPELAALVQDPLHDVGWTPPPRAIHFAGTSFNMSELSGKLGLEVALRSKRFVKAQLGRIPGRSFFESSVSIGDERAKKLSIPTMSSVYYQLTNERFRFATKKAIMKTMVEGVGAEASAEAELVALGVWPSRLPALARMLGLLMPGPQARNWAEFLQHFQFAGLSLGLKEARLSLRAEIRPQQ